jgi:hypothetical protein
MAKPDLQIARVTPAGELYRDPGKEPQALAFGNLLTAFGPGDATASGVRVGGLYVDATTSGISVRLL